MCEICLKLTIKTPKRQWHRSGVFLLSVSIVDFEQLNISWVAKQVLLLTTFIEFWSSFNIDFVNILTTLCREFKLLLINE